MDSRAKLLEGGKAGPAIVPGHASQSLLVQAVEHTHARFKMPPQGKLEAVEVADLRRWIDAGAEWPAAAPAAVPVKKISAEQRAFWSFQPLSKPPIPALRDKSAATNIDRFLLERLEKEGLTPSPETDRRTLLRRITFDLTGLPPTPDETADFVKDTAPGAYARVVERLLSSRHYGERWARYWLDLARYSDGKQGAREDSPLANAFRYRDWVVDAFNRDLPYSHFIKAQIAADLLPEPERAAALPGLGFQSLGESDADRLDVSTRVFLGLTVGCAQCHDHKFDPIPTRDYYSLLGVFSSSKVDEFALTEAARVTAYKEAKQNLADKQAELKRFQESLTRQVVDILAARTADYVVAASRALRKQPLPADSDLDKECVERWTRLLTEATKEHPHFEPWFALVRKHGGPEKIPEAETGEAARQLQDAVRAVLADKKAIDDRNYVKLGGLEGMKDEGKVISTLVEALPIDRYYFWRDVASGPYKIEDLRFPGGAFFYSGKDVERFLSPAWKSYLTALRAEVKTLEKAVPEAYPFLHVLADKPDPKNARVALRGDAANPGEEAPRRFLSVLCDGEPEPYKQGSGRLELAESIASTKNPLTARVMVNRIWALHFGQGIVRSTSNFGQLGDRPTHPELLDYLAGRFIDSGWSVKAIHREILMSAAYRMQSAETPASNVEKDSDNRLLWRANVRERLDAEAMRDSILAVSGSLDRQLGGPAKPLTDDYARRTLYVTVSRGQPDRTMALLDFPDANSSSEQRITTVGPMQRLFFLNSGFVTRQAAELAKRLEREAATDSARIARAYELLFTRPATPDETRLGLEFLAGDAKRWPQYAQVLLGTAEFSSVK